MHRSRLLTFPALIGAHAVASFATMWCCVPRTGPPELFFGTMFFPTILLLQFKEDPHQMPDLNALIGLPEDSPVEIVLVLLGNSLLWVASACCAWLVGRWVWRKVAPTCE